MTADELNPHPRGATAHRVWRNGWRACASHTVRSLMKKPEVARLRDKPEPKEVL